MIAVPPSLYMKRILYSLLHASFVCNGNNPGKLMPCIFRLSGLSGSEATFRRLVFLKCLSADGSLSLVWTNLRVLLFINAFTYKLLNMIAIESPFVKDFRDFSETLKGYTNPKHFMI